MARDQPTHEATWQHAGGALERVEVRHENGGWTIDGTIARGGDGHDDVHYVLRTDDAWHVRQFLLFRDADEPDLWLAADGTGRWGEVNGSWRDDLQGCVDVQVTSTATAYLALVRRARGEVGERLASLTAIVDVETLEVRVVAREATHVALRRWRFADGDEPATEHLVDEQGLVLDDDGRSKPRA